MKPPPAPPIYEFENIKILTMAASKSILYLLIFEKVLYKIISEKILLKPISTTIEINAKFTLPTIKTLKNVEKTLSKTVSKFAAKSIFSFRNTFRYVSISKEFFPSKIQIGNKIAMYCNPSLY